MNSTGLEQTMSRHADLLKTWLIVLAFGVLIAGGAYFIHQSLDGMSLVPHVG